MVELSTQVDFDMNMGALPSESMNMNIEAQKKHRGEAMTLQMLMGKPAWRPVKSVMDAVLPGDKIGFFPTSAGIKKHSPTATSIQFEGQA